MNVAFRSATFGGFNKEDVMSYIERITKEHKAALEQANAEAAAAQEQAEELSRQNSELRQQAESQQGVSQDQADELVEQLKQAQDERDSLRERFDQLDLMGMEERFRSLKNDVEEKSAEAEQLRKENEEKDAALAAKEQELEALREQMQDRDKEADSYRTLVSSIGQIEMDMRLRTTIMEQDAQKKADAQLAVTQERCAVMRRDAEAEAEQILSTAKAQDQELRRQIGERLAAFRSDIAQAVNEVNSSVARALEENAQMQTLLEGLNGFLNEHQQAAEAMTISLEERGEDGTTETYSV